jgi:tetratricopeptide (TPR) repeat protein
MSRLRTREHHTVRLLHVLAVLLCACVGVGMLHAENARARGERLFLEDDPAGARGYLEQALQENPQDFRLHMYLAVVLEQLADYDAAIDVLLKASQLPDADLGVVYFNLANSHFRNGDTEKADQYYSQAVEEDSQFADAYLNRANLRVRGSEYDGAISDYRSYLRLEPESSQRRDVERMIALLQDTQEAERRQAEEERRRAEELARQEREAEAARVAEERRQAEAAEREAREAEERRRALLDSVLDSLGGATGEGRSVRAPGEDLEDIDDDFLDIAD